MWAGVGGSTTVYTASWPRFRPSDFRKGTEHGAAPDWPFTYEDLAPWYDLNDLLAGVSGVEGDPAIPPRGPFHTAATSPGAVRPDRERRVRQLGWHWWPMPSGDHLRGLRRPPGLQQLRRVPVRLPARVDERHSVTAWPKAHRRRRGVADPCSRRPDRDRPRRRATGAVYIDRNWRRHGMFSRPTWSSWRPTGSGQPRCS